MKSTANDDKCQHCAKEFATNRIIWEDDDGELWFEDWCSDCTGYADDYVCISPLAGRMMFVEGAFVRVH